MSKICFYKITVFIYIIMKTKIYIGTKASLQSAEKEGFSKL